MEWDVELFAETKGQHRIVIHKKINVIFVNESVL